MDVFSVPFKYSKQEWVQTLHVPQFPGPEKSSAPHRGAWGKTKLRPPPLSPISPGHATRNCGKIEDAAEKVELGGMSLHPLRLMRVPHLQQQEPSRLQPEGRGPEERAVAVHAVRTAVEGHAGLEVPHVPHEPAYGLRWDIGGIADDQVALRPDGQVSGRPGVEQEGPAKKPVMPEVAPGAGERLRVSLGQEPEGPRPLQQDRGGDAATARPSTKIGRASCRERV